MSINLLQAFFIGVVYYLGINGTPWLSLLGSTIMNRPLICGTLVGIILGHPIEGCIIGAAINLPYLAYISAGGTVPMDPGLAGTLGTALAIIAGASPQVAVSLAVPIGLLGTIIWIIHMTVDISFLHMADKAAEEGNVKRLNIIQMFPPQIFLFVISVIPVFIAVYFGSGVVSDVLNSIKGTPLHVLQVIGGVLPALGIAMILKAINRKGIILFFLIGFIAAVYFKLPIIVISVIGLIIAYIYTELSFKTAKGEE